MPAIVTGQKLRIYPLLAAFEAFHNGSWHGVNSVRIRDGALLVKFVSSGSTVQHDIDGSYLRIRSRKATCSDCSHVLKPGADVCVWQATYRGETKDSVCHLTTLFQVHFLTSSKTLLSLLQSACSLVGFWADKPCWCWFVVRGKHCWLVDKPWLKPTSEHAEYGERIYHFWCIHVI